jgi:AbiV family abortive infection protein
MKLNVYREWGEKAAANALQLAEESRILLEAKHLPRAYYLAHMSTEEAAKSMLLYTMSVSGTPTSALPKVMGLLRNHKKKIEFVVSYASSLSPSLKAQLSGLHAELVAHINDLKNNTMYVSCEQGAIFTPEEKVSGITVSVHVNVAEGLASLAKSLLTNRSGESPSAIAEFKR